MKMNYKGTEAQSYRKEIPGVIFTARHINYAVLSNSS
jgi:hypothetical protein